MALSTGMPIPGNAGTLEPTMDSAGAIVNNGPMPAPNGRISSFAQGVADAEGVTGTLPCAAGGCMNPSDPSSFRGQLCTQHGGM